MSESRKFWRRSPSPAPGGESQSFWKQGASRPGVAKRVEKPADAAAVKKQTLVVNLAAEAVDSAAFDAAACTFPSGRPQAARREDEGEHPPQPQRALSGPDVVAAAVPAPGTGAACFARSRRERFARTLGENVVSVANLRKLAWQGIPREHRPLCWKILCGYAPPNSDRREDVVQRKRAEYHENAHRFIKEDRGETEEAVINQIGKDLPRTAPDIVLFQNPAIQKMMERILYMWAMLHPASSYVQGLNDLLTPFIIVFLSEYTDVLFQPGDDTFIQQCENIDAHVSPEQLKNVEADSYWCLAKLLDNIQDNYIAEQPGIHRSLKKLQDLVQMIDPLLVQHILSQGMEFMQFAFRWINCLLMRDLPFHLIIRLWDTYMSEPNGEGFSILHVYASAAIIIRYKAQIMQKEMPELMLFMQHLPTQSWDVRDLEDVLSQAFIYRTLYQDSHQLRDK